MCNKYLLLLNVLQEFKSFLKNNFLKNDQYFIFMIVNKKKFTLFMVLLIINVDYRLVIMI